MLLYLENLVKLQIPVGLRVVQLVVEEATLIISAPLISLPPWEGLCTESLFVHRIETSFFVCVRCLCSRKRLLKALLLDLVITLVCGRVAPRSQAFPLLVGGGTSNAHAKGKARRFGGVPRRSVSSPSFSSLRVSFVILALFFFF